MCSETSGRAKTWGKKIGKSSSGGVHHAVNLLLAADHLENNRHTISTQFQRTVGHILPFITELMAMYMQLVNRVLRLFP